jgi:hypothetical protein
MKTRSTEAPPITVGNHTYIPLYIGGKPHNHASDILTDLNAFEQEHPELELTSWNIEKVQYAHGVDEYIYGLWVNHRPREKKGE